MPIWNRDWYRDWFFKGKHPPTCTCVNCTNKRLGKSDTKHSAARKNITPIKTSKPDSIESAEPAPVVQKDAYHKRANKINNYVLSLLFIFAVSVIGLGISLYISSSVPFWLLSGFSFIYSIEKWFIYFTRKYKVIGKLYRLLLNFSILSLLGLIIWWGIKLFSKQLTQSPLIGSLILLVEFILFIWMWRIVSKNSWRWPSMKLTVFSLICLFVIFAFAGVQPFTQYKDYSISTLNNWGKSLQTNVQEKEPAPIDNQTPANSPNIITDKILNPQWWSGTDQESITSRSQTLFELTNEKRMNKGLSPLQRNTQLNKLAQEKAESMNNAKVETGLSHSGFDERARIANSLGFVLVAENIAYGGFEASSFIEMWMNSPLHKANILNRGLTHVGIGVYGKYAVQFFGGY